MLLDAEYQVICPDLMGFGGTAAPKVPPESIAYYGFKRAADDIIQLATQLGISQFILGGHDWGGAIVYRIALWYPDRVTHVFAICTPYTPPSKDYVPLEKLVKSGRLPNFGYQLHLASGEIEERIKSKEQIKMFLNCLFGGTGPNGERGFYVQEGLRFDELPILKPTKLIDEATLDYYADRYKTNGMHGTLNWYRNREQNFKDELELDKTTIDVPVLFVQATRDQALPPAMSEGMEKYVPNLTRKSVEASHWALWEAPEQVNSLIEEWLKKIVASQAML
ncbi:MAG: hypothetical protein Q9195_002182 [Heterodermia aff. obscurata]